MTQNHSNHIKESLSDLEIHTLICSKDVLLAINNFKSLQKFSEFLNTTVYLHDDGSLTDDDTRILLSNIKNCFLIGRSFADEEIKKYIERHPNCTNYRLESSSINLWHKIKLFDYFFFSKTKKILGVDSDLLFIRKPENIIKLIYENIPFYFPDLQDAYCFNEPKEEIPVYEKVNTGLIYIPSENYYNLDDIEFALSNLLKNNINNFPSWIEQSAFAHMFYKNGKYVSLAAEKYKIPYFQSVDIDVVECLHFVSYPAVRETYQTYIDYLNLNGTTEDLLYKKKFFVSFKQYKIPLWIELYKRDTFYNVKYRWGLKETPQQFLDHVFKIKTTEGIVEKKFQSNQIGAFIFNTEDLYITIEHTYEWYGEVEWRELDVIYL